MWLTITKAYFENQTATGLEVTNSHRPHSWTATNCRRPSILWRCDFDHVISLLVSPSPREPVVSTHVLGARADSSSRAKGASPFLRGLRNPHLHRHPTCVSEQTLEP